MRSLLAIYGTPTRLWGAFWIEERAMTSFEAPDFLTIEEAAAVLRISRTAAYKLAHQYLRTNGREGLPVVRIGRNLRVPRYQLERMLGGPINWAAITRHSARALQSIALSEPGARGSLSFER
jgi:excisionase family DNA binding protein